MLVITSLCIVSPLIASTESGTSCSDCSRFCAVTTTSSRTAADAVQLAGNAAASTRTLLTAAERTWFISLPL